MVLLKKNSDGVSEYLTKMAQVACWFVLINKILKVDTEGSIELKEMTKIMMTLLELEGVGRVEIVSP